MYLLDLRIQPGAWRLFATRRSNPKFAKFSEKVFQRDNYTCQFCGFQAKDYQEVINLDQDYYNNKLPNLVTACCFCTQCFFLNTVGVGYGGGTLIHMPEISQAELNSFCHVLFCSITNNTGYKDTSQSIYRNLKFRSQAIENLYGEGSSDPAVFSQLCLDTQIPTEETKSILADLRLLPSRARFRIQIEHWAVTALQELSSEA